MADSKRWNSLALRLVLGLTALRLLWHLFTPIGLLGDEAYYWDWGRHLDWGYFSKPPLIGWLYGSLGRLTNDSLYVFKAFATLLTGGGLWFFYLAVRKIFNAGLAFWALAASALSIGNTLLASILTIDAPLLFCWCLAFYLYCRLLFSAGNPSWRDALLLTLALGFGHLSKQMMLAFIPLMFGGAWFSQPSLLRKPHLYLASLLSLLFLLPPLLWNISHDWITVTHTGHHFESEPFDLAEIAGRYLSLGGVSALLLTPILFVLMLGAIWSLRHWSRQPPEIKMLCCFGAAALLGIAVLGLRQEINPNWPAVFYPGAIALTTWWCLKGDAPKRAEWFRKSIALGAAFTVALMGFLLYLTHADPDWAPAQRRGWRGAPSLTAQLTSDSDQEARAREDDLFRNQERRQIIVIGHRFTASQLAYHLRSSSDVFLWPSRKGVNSQYDLWPGPQPGSNCLLCIERKNERHTGELAPEVAARFEEVTRNIEYELHPSLGFPRYTFYLAKGLKDWPAPTMESPTP